MGRFVFDFVKGADNQVMRFWWSLTGVVAGLLISGCAGNSGGVGSGGTGGGGGGGAAFTLAYVVSNGNSLGVLSSGSKVATQVYFSPGSIRNLRLRPGGGVLLFDDGVSAFRVNTDGSGLFAYPNLRFADWNSDGSGLYGVTADSKLVRVNLDGTGATVLFDGNQGAGIQGIAMRPGGGRIGFRYGPTGNWQIHTVMEDGSGLLAVTPAGADYRFFSYSSDGGKIVAEKTVGGQSDIVILNANGSGEVNLTNSPSAIEQYPTFANGGLKIYYSATTGAATDRELWEMGLDGSNPVTVTDSQVNETFSVAIP